jgi:colanic acid/amylovoran biosynthesis glycosyltransferase
MSSMTDSKPLRVGYLIPEFPGQTHVWMWREIVHLREWGMNIRLYSTRRPSERDRARHAFAAAASEETVYLWPQPRTSLVTGLIWAIFTRPRRFLQCLKLAFTLPVEHQPGRQRYVLPLVPIACVFSRDVVRTGISHLHCHTCASGAVIAMMVRRLAGIPYSMTLNANLEWWGGAMREKLSEAAFTIAITEWLLAQVRREYPELSPGQSLLGRIGVDTRKWVPRTARIVDDGVFRIVTVGRLHKSKGHDVLLRSIAKVARDMRDLLNAKRQLKLTIIGDGPEKNALESLAEQLNIREMVVFAGSLGEESVIEELQHSDVFVLASHSEPLGVVYMEAMALELPTVGTAAGGVSEIIDNSHSGWLVPPGSADALAELLIWLINNPEARAKIATCGRRSVQERFDSRIGAKTLCQKLTSEAKRKSAAIGGENV